MVTRRDGKPACTCDSQLPPRADVEPQPLLADPAGHGGAEERLCGVRDIGSHRAEGVAEVTAARPEVVLVDDVGGRAVIDRDVAYVDPGDGQCAVAVAFDADGPQPCEQRVDVCGLAQPTPDRSSPRRRAAHPPRAPSSAHIRSGAVTPSSCRPFAMTMRVASLSQSRARVSSLTSSSPRGRIRQLS